jgi:hypothetical protein
MNKQYSEFTRSGYRRLLRLALSRYRFVPLAEFSGEVGACIWRHDVDISPQAARAIGNIEAGEGVRSVFYFNLRSPFYNLLESDNLNVVKALQDMGHDIGLHFDASVLSSPLICDLERALDIERNIFKWILSYDVQSFSFHNPGAHTAGFKDERYAGLVNAYSRIFFDHCAYCSDSNGYWRHTPLSTFLSADHPSAYVLTHPDWWTPRPMSPRRRVLRAVRGRAQAVVAGYDSRLLASGRTNIK